MSTPLVQEIASAAVADGSDHPDLRILAELGHSGRYPGNMSEDLLAKLNDFPVRNSLSAMPVYIKKPPNQIIKMSQPVLWPHELFASIFETHPEAFKESMLGGSDANIGELVPGALVE